MAARQGISIRKAKSKNPNAKYRAVRTRYTYRKVSNKDKNKIQKYNYRKRILTRRNTRRKYSYR